MKSFLTANGQLVKVSHRGRLGRGGEGDVLRVSGSSRLVAKLFHNPRPERLAKLDLMIRNPLPQPDKKAAFAWPIDVLFAGQSFVGYTMPKIDASHPLFVWYNPGARNDTSLGLDFRHLVRGARNLASLVSLAHNQGYVIGDLNESNVLIGPDSTVTLIDTDSWQVRDATRGITYRCPVGKGEFLPPELHGKNLGHVDRYPHHDCFALAILLFKMLAQGSHSHSGIWKGSGETPSIEERIRASILPFRDRSGLWSLPAHAIRFEELAPCLRTLFTRCLEVGHSHPKIRPTARAWQKALSEAEKQLHLCCRNSRHWHWGDVCPWCRRKALLGGVDPFPDAGKPAAIKVRPRAKCPHASRQTQPVRICPPTSPPSPDGCGCLVIIVIFLLVAAAATAFGVALVDRLRDGPALIPMLKQVITRRTHAGTFEDEKSANQTNRDQSLQR